MRRAIVIAAMVVASLPAMAGSGYTCENPKTRAIRVQGNPNCPEGFVLTHETKLPKQPGEEPSYKAPYEADLDALVGKSKAEVREAIGYPDSQNVSGGAQQREQWVYRLLNKSAYIYFTNGVMTSWQRYN